MSMTLRRSLLVIAAVALAIIVLALGGRPAAAQSDNPDLWYAEFWTNQELRGTPIMTRWDRTIDFRWWGGAPDPRVGDDNFSVRWTRAVPFAAGNYRFFATMDDGMRVWINDQLIIDSWTRSQEHTVSVDRFIPAGTHNIRVEHFEDGGQATAIFRWELIGTGNAGPQFPNWRGVYFNTVNLSGAPVLVRDDAYLNQNWGTGSPAPGIVNSDLWSARWTRAVAVQPGRYRVVLTSDDGSRLWINNQLIIDNWIDQTTVRSAEVTATGNSVNVVVEFYDNFGPAHLQVDLIPLGGAAVLPTQPTTCNLMPTGLQAVVTSTVPLNVRRGPGTLFEAITQLQPCSSVAMTGFRNADSQWVQVLLAGGQTGWVSAQYVRTGVPVASLTATN